MNEQEVPPMPDESLIPLAIDKQVQRLTRAAKWYRRWIALQMVVLILVIATCVTLGIYIGKANTLTSRIQQGSISGCQQGNIRASVNTKVWDAFLGILLDTSSNAKISTWDAFEKTVNETIPPAEAGIWDKYLKLYLTVTPQTKATAAGFEKYVAQANAPRNCNAAYGK